MQHLGDDVWHLSTRKSIETVWSERHFKEWLILFHFFPCFLYLNGTIPFQITTNDGGNSGYFNDRLTDWLKLLQTHTSYHLNYPGQLRGDLASCHAVLIEQISTSSSKLETFVAFCARIKAHILQLEGIHMHRCTRIQLTIAINNKLTNFKWLPKSSRDFSSWMAGDREEEDIWAKMFQAG